MSVFAYLVAWPRTRRAIWRTEDPAAIATRTLCATLSFVPAFLTSKEVSEDYAWRKGNVGRDIVSAIQWL